MWIVVPCYRDLGKRFFSRFWDDLLLTCKENDELVNQQKAVGHKLLWTKNFMQKNHGESLQKTYENQIQKHGACVLFLKADSSWSFVWVNLFSRSEKQAAFPPNNKSSLWKISEQIQFTIIQLLVSIFAKATVVSILALRPT